METRQDNVPTHLTVHILDPVKHFQKLKSMWNRAEEEQSRGEAENLHHGPPIWGNIQPDFRMPCLPYKLQTTED